MPINVCSFCGNATDDPKVKISNNGVEYASFSIAVPDRVFDAGTHEWQDIVAFADLIAFDSEVIGYIKERVHRGTRVLVNCRMQQSVYTDKNGNIRKWTSYRINEIDAYDGAKKEKWHSKNWF